MKTFFRPEMNVASNTSFSPSAGKPQQFVDYLKGKKSKLELVSDFAPLTSQEISTTHCPEYVKSVLNLSASNGFGNKLPEVARSLPYTTGSIYAAAEYALKTRENTFSPTSGFHHAGFNRGGGFCTFNGLLIAAGLLKERNPEVKRIGIVDCDAHYGNGTDEIIRKISADWITHYTLGGDHLRSGADWVSRFPGIIEKFKGVDLIIYQAGADPHVNDPLGGLLTTEEMRMRDEIVFVTFHKLGIPVVWNLAGGYQNPIERVLELHKTTYDIAMRYSL